MNTRRYALLIGTLAALIQTINSAKVFFNLNQGADKWRYYAAGTGLLIFASMFLLSLVGLLIDVGIGRKTLDQWLLRSSAKLFLQ